jgi:subtilase family serine protease
MRRIFMHVCARERCLRGGIFMRRILTVGLLSAFATIATVWSAAAETAVERSGNTYHAAVCGRVVGNAARCHARIVTDHAGNPLAGKVPAIRGYIPSDLRDAYKISATGSSSTIIAIVDAFGYDSAEADLGVYRSQFGLPPCTTDNGCFKKLNQKGQQKNYPDMDVGWARESALDLDMASAMCPNCQLWLVEAKSNSLKNLATSVVLAASLGAHVISNSYGGGDTRGAVSYDSFYDHPGVAVTASSGDSGYGTQFPAASAHVIAVGGTSLLQDGSDRGWSETVWGGAGSGCSRNYAKPDWQSDKKCRTRMEADVSAVADPATGVAVYGPLTKTTSNWLEFGGTSVAAPLIGGVYGANGGSVNYGSNLYAHSDALFDVTSGNNGVCPAKKPYFCNGEVGYDGPTGLGTPNGTTAFGD